MDVPRILREEKGETIDYGADHRWWHKYEGCYYSTLWASCQPATHPMPLVQDIHSRVASDPILILR